MKTVVGSIDRIIVRKENWLKAAFMPGDGGDFEDTLIVVGEIEGAKPGLTYSLDLEEEHHEVYGPQHRIKGYSLRKPISKDGVRSFLETLPGVGPLTAGNILDKYSPEEAIEALRDRPLEVASVVPRFGAKAASRAALELQERESNIEDEVQLRTILAGCKPHTIKAAKREWGTKTRSILEANPYRLTDLPGVGFLEADSVAHRLGIRGDDERRVEAGLSHRAMESRSNGSTLFSFDSIVHSTMELLGTGDREKIADVINNSNNWYAWEGSGTCQLAVDHSNEMKVATFIEERCGKSAADAADFNFGKMPESLMSDQQDAFMWAKYFNQLFIITGAPGTGKTHLMKSLIEDRGVKTLLMAPTGKAAQRLSIMTGRKASTIHRAMGAMVIDGKFEFRHNETNPLEAKLVVVDEFSMVDSGLAAKLFRAISPDTDVLLVGDHYQLPSVGPGAVLRDMLTNGTVPSFELTEIKRQDPGAIVTTCHSIKDKKPIDHDKINKTDLWIDTALSNNEVMEKLVELYTRRIPAFLGKQGICKPGDSLSTAFPHIQLLTPRRKNHPLSANEINQRIRNALIYAGVVQTSSWRYGVGDRVIQTKNDYDLGVFNGDMGTVVGMMEHKKSKSLCYRVQWDAGSLADESLIPAKDNALEFAYAVTVHKSQGSEWPVVICPFSSSFGPFFGRNILYTAISRASKMFVGVGTFNAMSEAAANVREDGRRTGLLEKVAMLNNKVVEEA